MCLAIYKPKNQKFPSDKVLENAWGYNPHGAGLAILHDDCVEIIKGIMTLEALLDFLPLIDIKKEVVLHLRYSTSGKIEPAMCHPFPIEHSKTAYRKLTHMTKKALVHNGVMFQPRLNQVSDTAIFSRLMALNPNMCDKTIKRIVGSDRLAILDSNAQKVSLIGDWIKKDGVFYSNTYSLVSSRYEEKSFNAYSKNDSYDDDSMEICPCCGSEDTIKIGYATKTYECYECLTVYNETNFLESELSQDISSGKYDLTEDDYYFFKHKKLG